MVQFVTCPGTRATWWPGLPSPSRPFPGARGWLPCRAVQNKELESRRREDWKVMSRKEGRVDGRREKSSSKGKIWRKNGKIKKKIKKSGAVNTIFLHCLLPGMPVEMALDKQHQAPSNVHTDTPQGTRYRLVPICDRCFSRNQICQLNAISPFPCYTEHRKLSLQHHVLENLTWSYA